MPARVREIEQRLGALRGATAESAPSGQRLGFGLALERQRVETTRPSNSMSLSEPPDTIELTPAVQLSPGAYGRLDPPPELMVYGNGRVPAEALSPVGDSGHILWEPAALGLDRLIDDAAADGVTVGVTDSYRPIEVQERLAREKGLYHQGGLAAVPGTSNHGWGIATDLDLDAPGLAWMRSNAWRYGFVEDVPREPWHWTYRPAG